MSAGPPRGWRRLLASVVPRRDRESLVDEMDRLYRTRVASEGERAARRWYRGEVMDFARRAPFEWVRSSLEGTAGELNALGSVFRQTVRSLLRAPGFSLLAVATLGIGIGAGAVIVGIADRALFRPLPYPEADRVVSVLDGWATSVGSVEVMRAEMTTVAALGSAENASGMTLERDGSPPLRVSVANITPGYFEAVSPAPVLGRLFRPDESEPGAARVVLLGHGFWQAELGGESDVLGHTLVLDGAPHEIVGVLPAGFDLPSARNDLWRAAVVDASNPGAHWGSGRNTVLARMAPGVSTEQVRQDVLRVGESVRLANPLWTPNPEFWDAARVVALKESRSRWIRAPLLVLLGAVALVLLVVAANVASLFLSRALARGRSLTVRAALGAGGARLAREQVYEVLVVTAGGLLCGLFLAWGGLLAIGPHLPEELPGAGDLSLDGRIVGITALVSVLTALAAGALPAVRAARHAPAAGLRESGRGGGMSRSRRRATRGLVAAQLAAAIVLVTGAGLLSRTIVELTRVDPGFETGGRVTAQVHLPAGLPEDGEARASYFIALQEAVLERGEIQAAAMASTIPFGPEVEYIAAAIDGVTTDPNDLPTMRHLRVTPSWFDVAGVPITRGRGFDSGDRVGSPLVAVIDETFVQRFFSGEDPIGRIVRYPWRGAPPMEVVGVAAPIAHEDLSAPPEPTMWVPLAQMGISLMGHATVVAVASAGSSLALGALVDAVRAYDDRIAVSDLAAYGELLSRSLAEQRLLMILLVVFAGTTLALGCVGVYGVAAFSVRQQVREIGVRLALGAPVSGIRRTVLGDGLRLALPGAVIGVLLAIPAARALEGMLFGIAAFDPVTFGAAPLILALAALVAVYVPARRATRVDPAVVLREE